MVSIKTTDIAQNFMNIAERIFKGEKILVAYPENQNLVIITEKEYNDLKAMQEQKTSLNSFRGVIKSMREQASDNGTDKMTMEEIDDIILETRQEARK